MLAVCLSTKSILTQGQWRQNRLLLLLAKPVVTALSLHGCYPKIVETTSWDQSAANILPIVPIYKTSTGYVRNVYVHTP